MGKHNPTVSGDGVVVISNFQYSLVGSDGGPLDASEYTVAVHCFSASNDLQYMQIRY